MTAYQMAVAECCNNVNGKHFGEQPCRLAGGGRCAYFEAAVLPLAEAFPDRYGDAAKAYWKRAAEDGGLEHRAVRQFQEAVDSGPRMCPQCGAHLAKRKRYCDGCRKARKRAAVRAAVSRHRNGGDGA